VVRGEVHHDNQSLKNGSNFFEAVLFLRCNRYLWDEKAVQEALLAVKDDQKMDRLEKKLQELNVEEQSEDDEEDEDMEESE
jgi:hypothetical protein